MPSRTIAFATSGAANLVRIAAQNRTITFAATTSSIVVRSSSKAVSALANTFVNMNRTSVQSQISSIVANTQGTILRTATQSRIIDALAQMDSYLIRAFNRTTDYAVGLVSQTSKATSRVSNAASTGLAYLLSGQSLRKTIDAATSGLAVTGRSTLHLVTLTTQPVVNLVRAIGATRTAQASLSTTVALAKRLSASINQSVGVAVDFSRAAVRNLIIDVQAFTEATSDAGKAFIRLAEALVALDAAMSKQMARTISGAPVSLASLFKSSSISSELDVNAQSEIQPTIGRTLAHDVNVEPTASNMKVLLVYINGQVQAMASFARQTLSRRSFSNDIASTPSVGKGATYTVQSNADLIASSNSGRNQDVNAEAAVDASLTARFGKAISSAVSGLADMIGAFIIGPRKTQKQRGGRGIGTSTNEERVRRRMRTMGISVQLGEAAAYKEYEFEDDDSNLDIRINIANVFTAAKNVAVAVKNIFIRQKPDAAPTAKVRIRNDRDQA
jgi:hypothetical protein